MKKLSVIAVIAALSAVAVACGSDTTPSGPSATGRPAGAVITGRVTGLATGTTRQIASTLASTTLTVTIVGTNISTAIDGNGQFTLTGVPPGDVQLKFSGSGVDATIILSGISASDRITITVSLNGKTAHLESERRENNQTGGTTELEGTVSNLKGDCPSLTFTVLGTTIKTTSETRFEGRCTRIAEGRRVEVEGIRQSDGTLAATEVDIED